MRTRAALFRAAGVPLELREIEVAEPGEGQVLVRMAAVGVCGSDLHVIRGEWQRPAPMLLGHEGSGIVEAVGPGVESPAPGDPVVISWAPSCGECAPCLAGRETACLALRAAILAGTMLDGTTGVEVDGGPVYRMTTVGALAEHVLVPADTALPVPADVPLEQAALLGCAALTGVGAALNGNRVQPGSSVLVIGAGGVGQFVVQGARIAGAGRIVAVDLFPARREAALALGAHEAFSPDDFAETDAFDVTFDAVGHTATSETALAAARGGGTAVLVGMPPGGARLDLDPLAFSNFEKTLTGSVYGSETPVRALPRLLDLVRGGELELASLVGPRFPLEAANEAVEASLAGAPGRVLVTSLPVGVRWSFRNKDAGSVRSRRLRARLRTQSSGRAARPDGTSCVSSTPPGPAEAADMLTRVATLQSNPLPLRDRDLLRTRAFVDGKWVEGDSGETFPVVDPATGEAIAEVPRLGAAETRRAIESAERALPAWRATTAKERARTLRRIADLMLENADDLALLLTAEQGKPLAESHAEIEYAASFLEWFGEEAKRVYGDTIPQPTPDRRILVTKQAVGVTGGITPWNFPSAMPTRKAAPALAAGCTMVLKPAEQTPLSALAVAELADRAGLPAGVLSVVTGDAVDAPEIGRELTSNPTVRKLGFTGSTEVGKLLMRQCAEQVKKVSLELGGNAPFIVFDDADLEEAVAGALLCKYRNSGQTCISANRMLVQDGIYDAFVERFAGAVAGLRVGSGREDGVNVGPLIDRPGLEKVERHVADARERGAEVLLGGARHELGQTFFQPSVLTGVTAEMAMSSEETFGPVAAIARFAEEDEAIRIANDTPYGLAAYFFSRDVGRVWRVAEGLEYGIVGINTGFISTEVAPFGGMKESGIGREGSKYGIDEWVELKYLALGGIEAAP